MDLVQIPQIGLSWTDSNEKSIGCSSSTSWEFLGSTSSCSKLLMTMYIGGVGEITIKDHIILFQIPFQQWLLVIKLQEFCFQY